MRLISPHERARKAFTTQRSKSKKRGILFLLSFDEWWSIWRASGRWHERGRGQGQYCMARFGDVGAYEVGNVKIILRTDNTSEACLGGHHTLEHRAKIAQALTGKVRSLEQRQNISKALKGRVGTKHTPEWCKAQSERHRAWWARQRAT